MNDLIIGMLVLAATLAVAIAFGLTFMAYLDGDGDGIRNSHLRDYHTGYRRWVYEVARKRAIQRKATQRLRAAENARLRAAQGRSDGTNDLDAA